MTHNSKELDILLEAINKLIDSQCYVGSSSFIQPSPPFLDHLFETNGAQVLRDTQLISVAFYLHWVTGGGILEETLHHLKLRYSERNKQWVYQKTIFNLSVCLESGQAMLKPIKECRAFSYQQLLDGSHVVVDHLEDTRPISINEYLLKLDKPSHQPLLDESLRRSFNLFDLSDKLNQREFLNKRTQDEIWYMKRMNRITSQPYSVFIPEQTNASGGSSLKL